MRNKETDMTLEKRIETAIAENIDPFTTDADIRFFETEEWNAAKVTLGTKIIGDFGGYTELWNGEIVKVDKKTKLMDAYAIDVKWSNGSISKMMTSEVCTLELLPERGLSPIGYYTEEAYYAA